jgi:hypothetical protein
MSALGQKQTSDSRLVMSALPPKADIVRHGGNVRFWGGEFNRSPRHLLILLEEEVCDGGDCTDMVHAAAEG